MTSKEALKSIAFSMRYRMKPKYVYESEQQNFVKIAKDLEVLEILKRLDWLVFNNVDKNDFNCYIDLNKSMKLTNEEVVKIKEWLHNETNKG